MRIIFKKSFEKQYKKLSDNIKQKVQEKNIIFEENQYDPVLNNHALHGKYMGYRSISISGNVRAIYKFLDKNTVVFVEIGSHSKLYS